MLLQTFGSVAVAQDAAGPGEAAFSRVCGQCHGPAGQGAVAPALVPMDRGLPELLDVTREGRGMMPPLSSTTISDEEIAQVVQYLKSLDGAGDKARPESVASPEVSAFSAAVARAAIIGDRIRLASAATEASGLLGRVTGKLDKQLLYYTAAYARWEFAIQGVDSKESGTALDDAVRLLGEAIGLDDKFAEGYILMAAV
ncbi:MAG: cytochrome c, partial [Phycisphaerales bacterium]|nr:cytochrome c [Phycisphaerales bacterium]